MQSKYYTRWIVIWAMDSTVLNLQTDEHVEGTKNIFKYVIIRQNQLTKKPYTHAETEQTTDTRLFTKRISKNIIIIKLNWWLICYCCNPYIHKMYKWVLVVMLCVMECCNKKKKIIINIVIEMVGTSAGMARGHPEYHQIRMRISLVQRKKNWIVWNIYFIRPISWGWRRLSTRLLNTNHSIHSFAYPAIEHQ